MSRHCCAIMTEQVTHRCHVHERPFDCPDNLIYYSARFDEYGIIVHDGGASYVMIDVCPWCGARLPESKRDRWFEELAQLGFDDPVYQEIPAAFQTDSWYRPAADVDAAVPPATAFTSQRRRLEL